MTNQILNFAKVLGLVLVVNLVATLPALAEVTVKSDEDSRTLVARDIKEHYFFRVYYCGTVAGYMWMGPDVWPGKAKHEQVMRDPRGLKLVSQAYVRAKRDGNIINVYEPDSVKCPDESET